MRRAVAMLVVLAAVACLANVARADGGAFVHLVRQDETLASIAQRYYGDPRRESVLVAENGLMTQGGAAIVVGLRLTIPTVAFHRVTAGETWAQLAARFFGDARRAPALMEANGSTSNAPDVGAEVLIPYPVRHIAGQHESAQDVAELYYRDEERAVLIKRFNGITGNRLQRGQVVLVPLYDLQLSEDGRRLVAEATGAMPAAGDVRAQQEQISAELPTLRAMVREGRFTEAVALGNRLIGAGVLTGNQAVTVHRELATAYVALARDDLAVSAFQEALRHQPDLELDLTRTSPTVIRAFQRARSAASRP